MSADNKYALLIGIGKRPDDEDSLAITAVDARTVGKKLTDTGGFPKSNTWVITEKETEKDRIIVKLNELIEKSKANKADLVIIYFSGHGCKQGDKYYLVKYDTDKDEKKIPDSALDGDLFINKLNEINTDKLVVLLDCCHSGGFASSGTVTKELVPFNQENFINVKNINRVIITSSEKWETSYTGEPVSVFTYALLEGLHGKDWRDDKKSINIFDLALYIRERTRALTKSSQNPGFNVLPKSFTNNFSIIEYEKKPKGLAFDVLFKLSKDGKEIQNIENIGRDEDKEFREIWCKRLKIDEAEIGFIKVDKISAEKLDVDEMHAKKLSFDDIADKAKEEIIRNGFLPIKIRIEKDKVVYVWKKNVEGKIKDVQTESKYSDSDLHKNVSDFFIKWAKAVQEYDYNTETSFQLLGKLLSRFIDLENQLNTNLNLYETLNEVNNEIKIGIMFEIVSEAGLLCNLPWEYLFLSKKNKGKITGRSTDKYTPYPSFFLAADENEGIHFLRQTNIIPYEKKLSSDISVVVIDYSSINPDNDELKKLLNDAMKEPGKINLKIYEWFDKFPKETFDKDYGSNIQYLISSGDITENYILHYKSGMIEIDNEPGIGIRFDDVDDLQYRNPVEFAGIFEKDLSIRPILAFIDCDHSAKVSDSGKSVAWELSKANIPAVIGFQDELDPELRKIFISTFYQSISQGADVATSITNARKLLKECKKEGMNKRKALYQFGTPVLYISTSKPVQVIEMNKPPAGKGIENAESDRKKITKYCQKCKEEGKPKYEYPEFKSSCDFKHPLARKKQQDDPQRFESKPEMNNQQIERENPKS